MSPEAPENSEAPENPEAPESPEAQGERRVRRRSRSDDDPVLPSVTRDELDEGWGDGRGGGAERDDDWYRRERPPHHG